MNIRNNFRIVIDGYNLIFQCGLEGKRRDSLALEKARLRAIQTINKWLGNQRQHTAIVFDAVRLPISEAHNVSVQDNLTIIYAVEYEDADSMIEEMIRTHSTPKQLLVVSSDHRLHRAALRRKSKPIDSDVWYDQLEAASKSGSLVDQPSSCRSGAPDEKDLPTGLDKIDWAKEFGIDDE